MIYYGSNALALRDEFKTLAGPSQGYYMNHGSKFLAHAFYVNSEEEAHQQIRIIKKDHPKARHFCTAWRLFQDPLLERSNDDGEPSGSAGKPILGQLIKNDLTNTMIIVVRYFGGTKLGIPGLTEAYKTSSANAIQAGKIIHRKLLSKVRINMNYEIFPHYLNFCLQSKVPVLDEMYGDNASFTVCFGKSEIENELLKNLQQYTKLDYATLQEYLDQLGITIEILPDDIII